ncbi:MAG: alpha-amylase family glycosyl hydrolase [Byssovorax sp.]
MPRSLLARALALALAGTSLAGAGGCGASEVKAPPRRDCRAFLWARPAHGEDVRVVGSWNGWAAPGMHLWPYGSDGWQVLPLVLPAGEYGYRFVQDGTSALDPYAPLSTYEGEQEVSLLTVPDCKIPEIRVDAVEVASGGSAIIRGTFLAAESGASLDEASVSAERETDAPIAPAEISAADGRFSFSLTGLARGKHRVTLRASDRSGVAAASALATVWIDPAASSWADGVLYQIMIDRYRGDGGAALAPPASLASRAGGTLDGVRAEIERGTFEALGVTALWLSPVYVNPTETRPGRDGHPSDSYHGYWPADDRAVDLTDRRRRPARRGRPAAHVRGPRVILDIVPNHVDETNPRYLDHEASGWFNDEPGHCVCGAPGCDWGTHIQTCWFAPYLPDVRFQRREAMPLAADDALFWMDSQDLDGVRIDAVPMMPRAASRRIAGALRAHASPRGSLFSIGEVFTGPGEGGLDSIRYHLGPDGLDAAFQFPLMWAIRDAFGADRAGFDAVEAILQASDKAFTGSGSLLGLMIDNHDTARFITDAEGKGAVDPWSSAPSQPADPSLYTRQAMALALLFALPGLPVLYYGDEIGLAGANDPDNRRVMPALEGLDDRQQGLLATVKRLGALRRCLPALRAGARHALVTAKKRWAFVRDAGDGALVIALFSKEPGSISMALPGAPAGDYLDAFTGAPVTITDGATIDVPPLSFKLLVPAKTPCP